MRVWPIFANTQALVDHLKQTVPRCLTPAQLKKYYLPSEPPRWCITGPGLETEKDPTKWQPKWPYNVEKDVKNPWIAWLAALDAGDDPELPVE